MKKIGSLFIFIIIIISGCSKSDSEKIDVVTTVYPLQLIVEAIGGNLVEVKSVYPPGSDPHSYEPTAKEMLDIQNADYVFFLSEVEEHFIHEVESSDNSAGTEYVNVSEFDSIKEYLGSEAYGISEHEGGEDEEKAILDSHLTISPDIDMIIVNEITKILSTNDVENKELYESNSAQLVAKLQEVDNKYKEFSKSQMHPIIVTHDAYGYLTSQYDIEIISLYGAHHDDEPSTKEIVEITDMIEQENISTIYVEQNDLENKVMKQISSQTGAKIEILNNMETKNNDDDLIEMLEKNLQVMEYNAQN